MVLVDVSDTIEDERILQIVGCTDSVQPVEVLDGQILMYDTEMQRVSTTSSANQPCLSAAATPDLAAGQRLGVRRGPAEGPLPV